MEWTYSRPRRIWRGALRERDAGPGWGSEEERTEASRRADTISI